jgi:tRNA1(Val) A37 N6-methylase TrmN6
VTVVTDRDYTTDAFLGGKLEVLQPADGGHRSGLEAVLLAASIEDGFQGALVDLGAGAGVAGLCVAGRVKGARVMLVDRDEVALAGARSTLSLASNRSFAERVSVMVADVTASEADRAAAGLGRELADATICNPPFYKPGEATVSPAASRAGAHVMPDQGLETWVRTAASILRPEGRIVVIFRADGLADLLSALAGRFGGTAVLPIHPRAGSRAHRILVRATKGSRGRLSILPGFALHGTTGSSYLPEADAILRDGKSLAEVHPAWDR